MTCSSRRGETGICVVKYSDSSDITPSYTYLNSTLFCVRIQLSQVDWLIKRGFDKVFSLMTENDREMINYG